MLFARDEQAPKGPIDFLLFWAWLPILARAREAIHLGVIKAPPGPAGRLLYLPRPLMRANGVGTSSEASRCSCQPSPLLSGAEPDRRRPAPRIRLANGG